ncbi:MAG: ATP phosphoribosyltransferase regulatory subunit [Chromatiales bacterium]|nr:ATP phosphoribosyltransferase regulatory subunit [Chromatiales bacterium]
MVKENEHWLLPEGINEVLPPNARVLEKLRRELLDLFDSWGYELVFPPFIEYLESLLTGTGGDLDLQTFKLTDQITGRTLGIRADITPQVARIDAHQLRREVPTRLCYLGTVLSTRGDGFAGSRSPLQIGAELYGHSGVESDLEVLSLMLAMLDCAGIEEIYLDLGHVGIFRGLTRQAGLDKGQEQALFKALQGKAIPEIRELIAGFGLSPDMGEMLCALAELSGDDCLEQARARLAGASDEVKAALDQLESLAEQLKRRKPGLPIHFDLGELRGYHYHTGVVFAAYIPGLGQEIARGGRYDEIGKVFGRARPASGFSADLNQLFRLGRYADAVAPHQSILAPSIEDESLYRTVDALRRDGKRVIFSLPEQSGDAQLMGCSQVLVKQGEAWVVEEA